MGGQTGKGDPMGIASRVRYVSGHPDRRPLSIQAQFARKTFLSTSARRVCENGPGAPIRRMDYQLIHHVALTVTELERSRKFYLEVLGFREIPRPPFTFP